MSNPFQKSMLKLAMNTIGEDTIINGLKSIASDLIEKKNATPLEEGEREIFAIAYEREGQILGALATIDNQGKISRIINPKNLETLIINLLKSM
jgi:hypothetical protein